MLERHAISWKALLALGGILLWAGVAPAQRGHGGHAGGHSGGHAGGHAGGHGHAGGQAQFGGHGYGGYGGYHRYGGSGWGVGIGLYSGLGGFGLGYYGYPRYYGYGYPGYYDYGSSGYYGYPGSYSSSYLYYPPPSYQSAAPAANTARVQVLLPNPEGEVWFDGRKTQATGTTRYFESPELEPGYSYTYKLTAAWHRDGRLVTEDRVVTVTPGSTTVVDFTRPEKGGS